MQGDQEQGKGELAIFRAFAEVAGLDVRSVEKRPEPEPDVLCEIDGIGRVAFEITEAVDPAFARQLEDQQTFRRVFHEEYWRLPKEIRDELKRRLGNAIVHVEFSPDASLKRRRASVPALLDLLKGVAPDFSGELHLRRVDRLAGVVTWIAIDRGPYDGPLFDTTRAVQVENRIFERLREKFGKSLKYESEAPVELLVYCYGVMPWPEKWLPKVRAFVVARLDSSGFRRVWLFDAGQRLIHFIYPREA